jgi:hypothetical protein
VTRTEPRKPSTRSRGFRADLAAVGSAALLVTAAGDGRPIDHIRADLFLGMTDGTYSGLDDAEIINQFLAAGDVDESGDPSGHHHDETTARNLTAASVSSVSLVSDAGPA